MLELYLGNVAAAQQQADLLDALAEGDDDAFAKANALNVRACLARYQGNLAESIRCFEHCREIAIVEGESAMCLCITVNSSANRRKS